MIAKIMKLTLYYTKRNNILHKNWFVIQVVTELVHKLVARGKNVLLGERTPKKLAIACTLGIFIAFSPLIGLHWLLTIILAWIFSVNVAVVYAAAHVVNNPLTMVPLYLGDYAVGLWVCDKLFQSNLVKHNPSWMQWLNVKLSCLGIANISLWAFIIGGHLVAFMASIVAFPILIRFFKKIIKSA
jgi:uncharacterized protein